MFTFKTDKMRINYIVFLIALVCFVSCSKEIKLDDLSFNVTADSLSYKPGSKASFAFEGKPNVITFYSGELGKQYEFRNRDSAEGIPQLRFSTQRNTGVQPNSLSLMISSDFAGGITSSSDPAAIAAATWTDISNRAAWASGTTVVPSGVVDLTDFAAAGKPVYIAFKYKAVLGSIQNKWTITSFSLRNVLSDGSQFILDTLPTVTTATNYGATSNMPGWGAKTVTNNYNWSLTATNLVITGASTVATATADAEAWVITGPIKLRKVTPAIGTVVQSVANYIPSFTYTYAKPGNYEPVFVASNANVNKQSSVAKTLAVTIQ